MPWARMPDSTFWAGAQFGESSALHIYGVYIPNWYYQGYLRK